MVEFSMMGSSRHAPKLLYAILAAMVFGTPVGWAEAPLAHTRMDALAYASEQMIEHGRHGHLHELVRHAEQVHRHAQTWIKKIEDLPRLERPVKVQALLKDVVQNTHHAIQAGERRNRIAAMNAARKAARDVQRIRKNLN